MPSTTEYLYGLNPAFEVLRAGRRTVHRAFLHGATAGQPRLAKLSELLQSRSVPVERRDKGQLADLCRSRDHQGAVLEASLYPYVAVEDLLSRARLLLLDNVEDPHNVGAILRSAEVFGFRSVLLARRGVPEIYPSVVKVSAGATEFLEISRDLAANGYVRRALEAGYEVAALDHRGQQDITALQGTAIEKLLLVVGGEDRSVGQYILNNAQHVLRIPQRGQVNSLNASVAVGIALFALAAGSQA
ncbi:RNA methyltransferase [bacterium]|nr:RNA methyltransferase [bacterium]